MNESVFICIGVVIGTFFGTLWGIYEGNWVISLIYMIFMTLFAIIYESASQYHRSCEW
jgi:ABC-type antimicrobial peptide transport system permease subunit